MNDPGLPVGVASTRADTFLLDLAAALHRSGLPSYRLEDSLMRVARVLGVPLQIFSVPTGITIGFGPPEAQRVRILRVEPGKENLTRVAVLSELIEDLATDSIDLVEAEARLAVLPIMPLPHGPIAVALAYSVASGSAAVLLGAGAGETVAASAIGLLIGLLSILAGKYERIARPFDFGAAALAGLLAGVLSASPWHLSRELTSLAAIIVLLPGYSFTLSLNELAARHLSAGTSRLGGAFTEFLMLVCGTATGYSVADYFVGPYQPGATTPLPTFAVCIAVLCLPLGFKTLFQARHRDTVPIVAATVVAYVGAYFGTRTFGSEVGAGVGSLALCIFSNALARLRRLPALITLVPGLLVLVPGSFGFRGLSILITHQGSGGLESFVYMLAIGTSLVCGLLVANVLLPSRRSL